MSNAAATLTPAQVRTLLGKARPKSMPVFCTPSARALMDLGLMTICPVRNRLVQTDAGKIFADAL